MEIGFLGTLTSQFGNTSHGLTLTLTLLYLILNNLSHILVDVQVVIDFLLNEIAHVFIDTHTIRCHRQRTKFNLRLTLEHRLFHIDGNGSHNTSTDVAILIFPEEIANCSSDMLLESTLMSSTLRGVLAIDEGIILLTILIPGGSVEKNLPAVQETQEMWV